MNFLSNGKRGSKLRAGLSIAVTALLLQTGLITSCEEPYIPPTTKKELGVAISDAIKLIYATREGTSAGLQLRGTKSVLIDSIEFAQRIYADITITIDRTKTGPDSVVTKYTPFNQVRTNLAYENLKTAVANFKSKTVVEIDPVNLVGQYTFDEIPSADVGTIVKDYSGKSHDGILATGSTMWGRGNPTFGTDRYGISNTQALYFNYGANVEIPYHTDLNPARFTISLWAKATGYNIYNRQYGISLNRSNGYQLVFDGTGPKANFTVNPAGSPGSFITDSGTSYIEGKWKHFVVTFGDGFMRFYTNGVLVKEAAHAGTAITLPTPVNLTIGQDLPTSLYSTNPASPYYINDGGYFIGYIDEVRIYKTVLTASQVTSIYTLEKP